MGFDSDKWAFEAVLEGSWNYMGLCNPLQAGTVDGIIKDLVYGSDGPIRYRRYPRPPG